VQIYSRKFKGFLSALCLPLAGTAGYALYCGYITTSMYQNQSAGPGGRGAGARRDGRRVGRAVGQQFRALQRVLILAWGADDLRSRGSI
jgi:hypothetical protein